MDFLDGKTNPRRTFVTGFTNPLKNSSFGLSNPEIIIGAFIRRIINPMNYYCKYSNTS
jgi:hypothetical protein